MSLELGTQLELTPKVIDSPNLTDWFEQKDLDALGAFVLEGFKKDDDSRDPWKKRMESGLNLALQLQEEKTFPWQGASNVKFPLVTIAAMQWHARAYPTLLQGPDIVKMQVIGQDPDGKKRARADRVSAHMSFQVLEEDSAWEEESDRLLLMLPILGCVFKKTYKDHARAHNVSDVVSPGDLVLNYWAKSVEDCPRKTHIYPLSRNDIYENVMAGVFRDVLEEEWLRVPPAPRATPESVKADKRKGQNPPQPDSSTPFRALEQHVRIDLDGDGYEEPYIVTVEEASGQVLRLVCNFDENDVIRRGNRILSIRSTEYFTKFPFIPSPDGGVYDIGFGVLLGPLNEAVDSLINQLIDAGTLSTTSGGFLGRGVKIRGGEYSFRPFGWQRVDSTGDDLAKGIFPMPVREPSAVLLQLLSLLIDYTNRMSGSTDIMVGENPGQNTPAQTSQMMAEQGAKINSAIYKRVWRAFKGEFQKLFLLNKKFVPVGPTAFGQKAGLISAEDYQGPEDAIRPAADPHLASDTHRVAQATMLKQLSMGGGYDKDAVERNLLRAMRVENMDELFKGFHAKGFEAPPPPKVMQEEVKGEIAIKRDAQKHHSKMEEKMVQLLVEKDKNLAELDKLKAETAEILAGIGGAQAALQVEQFEAAIKARESVDKSFQGYIELMQKAEEARNANQQGSGGGMAAPPGNGAPNGAAPTPSG